MACFERAGHLVEAMHYWQLTRAAASLPPYASPVPYLSLSLSPPFLVHVQHVVILHTPPACSWNVAKCKFTGVRFVLYVLQEHSSVVPGLTRRYSVLWLLFAQGDSPALSLKTLGRLPDLGQVQSKTVQPVTFESHRRNIIKPHGVFFFFTQSRNYDIS